MDQQTIAGHYGRRNLLAYILLLRWMRKSTIVEGIALMYVVLFLYTGVSKLMEYTVFREQLADSPVLGPFAGFIAWSLPLSEIGLAILLFIPATRGKALYAATLLMVLFTTYIVAILTFSDDLPCSCGGILEQLSWGGHLVFNGAFIAIGFLAIRLDHLLSKN